MADVIDSSEGAQAGTICWQPGFRRDYTRRGCDAQDIVQPTTPVKVRTVAGETQSGRC